MQDFNILYIKIQYVRTRILQFIAFIKVMLFISALSNPNEGAGERAKDVHLDYQLAPESFHQFGGDDDIMDGVSDHVAQVISPGTNITDIPIIIADFNRKNGNIIL